jgi:hypothetical protein
MVFGRTAMATDIRYVEPSGTNQEYIDYIIAVAAISHVDRGDMVRGCAGWTRAAASRASIPASSPSRRSLRRAVRYHTVNAGTHWGSAQRLTGCASIHLRIKRSGTNSPFTAACQPHDDPARACPIRSAPRQHRPGGSGTMRAGRSDHMGLCASGTEIGRTRAAVAGLSARLEDQRQAGGRLRHSAGAARPWQAGSRPPTSATRRSPHRPAHSRAITAPGWFRRMTIRARRFHHLRHDLQRPVPGDAGQARAGRDAQRPGARVRRSRSRR